ncbi:MAG: aldehyde dehydrogenase family protein, partial [Gemmatimonadota bacterium]
MASEIRSRLWINNAWEDAASGETFLSLNPATGEVLADVAAGDSADVARAVEAARAAVEHPKWRRMNPHKRARLLWKLADLIEQNADELGELETRDNGKPLF